MEARPATLAEPNARGDRISVVLGAAARSERDPDHELLELLEQLLDNPDAVAGRLVSDEDPDPPG